MDSVGSDMHVGRRAGHALCPMGSYEEGDLCPHTVHIALWMEDERYALNVRQDVANEWNSANLGSRGWRIPSL